MKKLIVLLAFVATFFSSGIQQGLAQTVISFQNQALNSVYFFSADAGWAVGYAYDHSFIPGFSSTGTHELMLEIRIPSKASATNGQFATQEYWYH